jgi:DNA-binding LacI/PurR family transcriptional regulator
MISSLELARLCGVSQGTVDRALHDRPGISAATRSRILDLAHKYGYRPDPSARELLGGERTIVGAIVPAINNIFFMDMMAELKSVLAESDLHLFIAPVSTADDFHRTLAEFASRRMRAAIVVPPQDDLPIDRTLTDALPVLSLLSPCRNRHIACLAADEILTGQTAVDHLHALGHRRIMHLTYARRARGIIDREKGYCRRMRSLHLSPHVEAFTGDRALIAAIESHRPTAIFCHNDWLALSAMRVLASINLTVPNEMSIVGVDNTPTFRAIFDRLTTLHYPLAAMAQRMAEWIRTGQLDSALPPLEIIAGHTVRPIRESADPTR